MSGVHLRDDLRSRCAVFLQVPGFSRGAGAAVALTVFSTFFLLSDGMPRAVLDAISWSKAGFVPSAEAPVVQSRLPRPRPDDPQITGSIAPALSPKTGAQSRQQSGRARAPETVHEDGLRSTAMMLASERCGEVLSSDILASRSDGADAVAVAVTCADGSRVYLEPAALENARLNRAQIPGNAVRRPELLSEAQAVDACERKLRDGLAVPDSFDRNPATSRFTSAPGGGALVSFDYAARNGLGFPFQMHAECVLDGGRIARLEAEPR